MAACSPSSQVTNNSGIVLNRIMVDVEEFAEYLDYCGDGYSSGFKAVPGGMNMISLKETEISEWVMFDELGPFEKNRHYSVNITKNDGTFCAELWKRLQTDSNFNDDTTKTLITRFCLPPG